MKTYCFTVEYVNPINGKKKTFDYDVPSFDVYSANHIMEKLIEQKEKEGWIAQNKLVVTNRK